jgi:hypothetical protein
MSTTNEINRPSVKAFKSGRRTLLDYDSLLRAIGKDPATEPVDRPKMVSIRRAVEISSLSRTTLWRMTRDGAQENCNAA